ncbi:hypothetical protein SKAU_G00349170 [Synaphobranchus kaupii]|uniref:Uncharacterized protein n=1 Tax=Synaphobranchus kaupii TaxID=118154 RepID=A0A9Q1EK74_SYNKA|nr:hypothetical protein SKAU_G00349170 [Synaphobranchus kaupii]
MRKRQTSCGNRTRGRRPGWIQRGGQAVQTAENDAQLAFPAVVKRLRDAVVNGVRNGAEPVEAQDSLNSGNGSIKSPGERLPDPSRRSVRRRYKRGATGSTPQPPPTSDLRGRKISL